jgi:hypothetical protein
LESSARAGWALKLMGEVAVNGRLPSRPQLGGLGTLFCMISYVLVVFVSLATGQPVHASLEGPMSPTSCERLITHAGYSGVDGTNLRAPPCLSWADAQGMLSQYFCKRTSGSSPRPWTREFDCLSPVPESAPASASTLPRPNDAPMPSNLALPSAASGSISLRVTPAQPEAPASSVRPAPWGQPFPRAQKRFSLGPASTALVAEARAQTHAGHYDVAAATIERALRIEPDNPLLWMEPGTGNRLAADCRNPARAGSQSRSSRGGPQGSYVGNTMRQLAAAAPASQDDNPVPALRTAPRTSPRPNATYLSWIA